MNDYERLKEIMHELMQMKGRIVKSIGEEKYVKMLEQYDGFRRGAVDKEGYRIWCPEHPKFIMAQAVEKSILDLHSFFVYIRDKSEEAERQHER